MRVPKCGKCKKHGVLVPVKGHKKSCPFKKCVCNYCYKPVSTNPAKKQRKLPVVLKQTEEIGPLNYSKWRRRRTFGDASLYNISEPKIFIRTERIYVLPRELLNQRQYTDFTIERLISPEKLPKKINFDCLQLNLSSCSIHQGANGSIKEEQ